MIVALLRGGQAGRHHRDQPQGHRQPARAVLDGRDAGSTSGRSSTGRRTRSSTTRRVVHAKDASRRPDAARRRAGEPRRRHVVAVGLAEDARAPSTSCSSTRPARSRWPTSSRWRARPTASSCSATRSSSTSRCRARIRPARIARRSRTCSATTPRCRRTAASSSRRTWRLHPDLCDVHLRGRSTTAGSSPSRTSRIQRLELGGARSTASGRASSRSRTTAPTTSRRSRRERSRRWPGRWSRAARRWIDRARASARRSAGTTS